MRPPNTVPLPADILLVEDSEDDVDLAQHAFKKYTRENAVVIHAARDGVEALQFLRHEPPFKDAPRPRLILLDLNMPRMDGRELLAVVKNDSVLKHIPVIVLTTSDWDVDIAKAYGCHANSYVIKPVDFQTFARKIGSLWEYWFDVVALSPSVDQGSAASCE